MSTTIKIRISGDERALIERAVATTTLTMSAWLRDVAHNEAKRVLGRGPDVATPAPAEVDVAQAEQDFDDDCPT